MAAKRKITATRVAAGLALGKSVSAIAREEGMSRGHVSAIANSDACQQIIADLVAVRTST